ncbi:MAG: hypothetical protein ISR79_00350 [Nitrosopumilus sp.]|nr:hypothetical protein [Nitrosopumilus sp.]
MNDKEEVKEIVETYVKLGKWISNESEKLQNKLESNGLETMDLETMFEQIDRWSHTLILMSEKLEPILKSRGDSI